MAVIDEEASVPTAAYVFYTVAQATLAVWAIRFYRRTPSVGAFTLFLPIAAVVYDNAMVALGSFIGDGRLLQVLSFPRFLGHAMLTPIWIVTAVAFAIRAGAFPSTGKRLLTGSWVLYALMVIIGFVNSVVLLEYAPVMQGDLFYYTNAGGLPGPPVPSIAMVLVVIACAMLVFRRIRWPWMLAGGLFMLLAAGVPTRLVGFVVSNSGEVVLAAALVATEAHLQQRARVALPAIATTPT